MDAVAGRSAQGRRLAASLLAAALVLACLIYALLIHALAPDFHHRSVQEDEHLEWITFWCFAGAAWLHLRVFRSRSREGVLAAWFPLALAAFCAFVALEEISWGQRLLGYRPPPYLLEHNGQQEMNLHNLVADDLRQGAFLAVVLGYGVGLPLLTAWHRAQPLLRPMHVHAPPLALSPAFLATAVFYQVYPFSHAGEWSELMLGAAMLFAAILERDSTVADSLGAPARIGVAAAAVVSLGVVTSQTWWALAPGDDQRVEVAKAELEALARDVASARTETRCGLHRRLYTYVQRHGPGGLRSGRFAALPSDGERAEFFLDPWSSPYWLAHVCSDDRRRRAIYVYSFGPNRLRDSDDWEIRPDDLAAWVIRP